jgi:glycosyltransferase involved in cell wall biosynthesis
MGIVVGVDASRNRTGGGVRHLVGLLHAADPRDHGVKAVHVWAPDSLLAALPDSSWLLKHRPPAGSLARELWWQRRSLPHEARAAGVDILLNTDAGTVCRAHPSVVMSRDMLSYEPGEMRRFGLSRMALRLAALRSVQNASMRDADGVIFLTQYAADVIQRATGNLPRVAIVPHGVSSAFRQPPKSFRSGARPIRCAYISPTDLYKHQWNVVRAIADLRRRGHDVTLLLAGGETGRGQDLLEEELRRSDPRGEFVTRRSFVAYGDLPALLADIDLFVFASSCENMPNTLIEGMASGLPIACSNRGPMPEVLRDAGTYFDPEDPASITAAVEKLLIDPDLRAALASRAAELSMQYSWERCAAETWAFLGATLAGVARTPRGAVEPSMAARA